MPEKFGFAGAVTVGHQELGVAGAYRGMHHLVLISRRDHGLIGRVLETHQHIDFGIDRFFVEFDRFVAAAFEDKIGLNVHQPILS